MRRAPAVLVPLSGMRAGLPRVRAVGRILGLDPAAGTAILDDGAGSTTLIFRSDEIGKVKEGALVRVFGKPGDDEIAAEIVQDMGALDVGLFKKVCEEVKDEG